MAARRFAAASIAAVLLLVIGAACHAGAIPAPNSGATAPAGGDLRPASLGGVSPSDVTTSLPLKINLPAGVAIDPSGTTLYATSPTLAYVVTDVLPNSVGRICSGLNRPHGVAVDANGNVFVADTYNNRIATCNAQKPQASP